MDSGEKDMCFAIEDTDKRTRWQRFLGRMFPYRHCPRPKSPETWKDCITTRTVTRLDWADWLRVIVSGVVCVDVRVATENEVGETRTEVVCYIGTRCRDVIRTTGVVMPRDVAGFANPSVPFDDVQKNNE